MTHRLSRIRTWRDWIPFGLAHTKPRHFRDMARVVRDNSDNLPYAWKVLTKGVCDGCALGTKGLRDWTIDGTHLCMTRLNLLRLNTAPAFDESVLADVTPLQGQSNRALRELGRIPFPFLRRKGEKGFHRISWDTAMARIAEHIRNSSPQRIAFFLTSRGITNETYYVAQKVARFLGTNNVDNAARLCHSPSTGAMKHALGVAATTCSYRDWWHAEVIIFFGANPANDQPVSMKYLHEAKQRGATVVLVNPYREPGMERYWVPSNLGSALFGTDIADYWFNVAQGGDIALLYGVIKILLAEGWHDTSFVAENTAEFETLRAQVDQLDWPELERSSGLSRSSMVELAEILRKAKTGVFVWSMGITQHRNGGDAVQMILNLGLLKGFVGRRGCGLMPIRGHSGVQGGAEMGAYSTALPGGLPINNENTSALSTHYGFDVPLQPGLTAPEMVEAAARKELDVLYCVGGNFLRTLPDPGYVEQAMRKIRLRVHQDIILSDQLFLDPGQEVILLPAKTRYEQDGGGTQTSTERRVAFSPQIERQVGEARSEWDALRLLATTVGGDRAPAIGCGSGDEIRAEIARVIPHYDGIQDLRKAGDAFQYGGPHLCADGNFATADGKAHFRAVPLPTPTHGDGTFELSTRRGKQFNSMIYADIDPLTGASRDAVFINPDDADGLHLRDRDHIALVNQHGRYEGRVFLAPIARGSLQVYWPEGNVLIESGINEGMGGVPDYNARVKIETRANQ